MRSLGGPLLGQYGIKACFESRPGPRSSGRNSGKSRSRPPTGHRGTERGEDRAQHPIGVHVVEGLGLPDQVDGVDGGPRRVQVRLEGGFVRPPKGAGVAPEVAKYLRGNVQGNRVGRSKAGQGEGAGTGAASEVEDPSEGR